MFSHYKQGFKSSKMTGILTIEELVRIIKDNPSKKEILALRSYAYKSEAYCQLKEKLPSITVHAVFNGAKKKEQVLRTSGYLYLDIDFHQIDKPIEQFRKELLERHKEHISVLSLSSGGRGLFILIKVKGVTKENFAVAHRYYTQDVFKDVPSDVNASGIHRSLILPYDPLVYFNPDVCLCIPEYIQRQRKAGKSLQKEDKEECYAETFQLPDIPDINDVMTRLKLSTNVDTGQKMLKIESNTCYNVWFPKHIPDGRKHATYRALTESVMVLNPEVEFLDILAVVNYLNENRTAGTKMKRREMYNTCRAAYDRVMETGEITVRGRVKKVHTNRSIGTREERHRIAAKAVGLIKQWDNARSVQQAKDLLSSSDGKVTKAAVARLARLSEKTVHKYWDANPEDIDKELRMLTDR